MQKEVLHEAHQALHEVHQVLRIQRATHQAPVANHQLVPQVLAIRKATHQVLQQLHLLQVLIQSHTEVPLQRVLTRLNQQVQHLMGERQQNKLTQHQIQILHLQHVRLQQTLQ